MSREIRVETSDIVSITISAALALFDSPWWWIVFFILVVCCVKTEVKVE